MKISTTMDLGALAERMGDADADDARAMRDLLVYSCNGSDTEEVTESAWLEMLGQASAARIAHDIVTRADFSSAEALDAYAEVIGKDVHDIRVRIDTRKVHGEKRQSARPAGCDIRAERGWCLRGRRGCPRIGYVGGCQRLPDFRAGGSVDGDSPGHAKPMTTHPRRSTRILPRVEPATLRAARDAAGHSQSQAQGRMGSCARDDDADQGVPPFTAVIHARSIRACTAAASASAASL